MSPNSKLHLLPVLLVSVGTGWLLTSVGILPGVNWVWTLGLAVVGLLTFAVGGFDKITFVTGLFFIATSFLSVLRQTDRISIDVEVPVLVIFMGVLLVIARHRAIPIPKWILDPPKPE